MTTRPRFGMTPPEPARQASLDGCAPAFTTKVGLLLDRMRSAGHDPIIFESRRTAERSAWLYGIGRDYDPDGRGIVTNILPDQHSWHFFGVAVDIISAAHEWDAPEAFWFDLMRFAEDLGLTSGDDWCRDGIPDEQQEKTRIDKPHVQWWCEGMHTSPSAHATELFQRDGLPAVWAALGAA